MQVSSIVSRGDNTIATPQWHHVVTGDAGEILGVVSFSTRCNENRPEVFLLHPRSKFLHDFAKAPQNKIVINNLSPVYQMLFLWVLRNTGNINTSSAPNGQRDPAFISQCIAHP